MIVPFFRPARSGGEDAKREERPSVVINPTAAGVPHRRSVIKSDRDKLGAQQCCQSSSTRVTKGCVLSASDECHHARRLAIAISRTLAPRGSHLGLGASAVAAGAMRALALSLVALLASSVGLVSGAETFHEEMLARPLPDGKVAFVAHFTQEAPLLAKHYETFPRAIAEIARASRAAEAELSFTRGRWYAARWGRAPLGAKPVGAELWASFHAPPPGPGVGVASPTKSAESAADAGWRALTTLLGAQFCASLGALDGAAVAAPRPAFHAWNGSPDAVVSDRRAASAPPRRGGVHGEPHPVAQAAALPRPRRRRLDAPLRSGCPARRRLVHDASRRRRRPRRGPRARRRPDPPPSQTVTLVLDPGDALNADGGGVRLSALWASRTVGRTARARRRRARAHAGRRRRFRGDGRRGNLRPTLRRAGISTSRPRVGRVVLRTGPRGITPNVGGHGNDDAGEGDRSTSACSVPTRRRRRGGRAAARSPASAGGGVLARAPRLERGDRDGELRRGDIDRHPASGRGRARRATSDAP